jgi:hypothetical protein
VTDPDNPKDLKGAAREGILALQIHAGPPMLVEFKDIRIRELKPKYGDAVVLFNGKDLDGWAVKGDTQKSKWVAGIAKMSSENPKLLVNKGGSGEMINLPWREHRYILQRKFRRLPHRAAGNGAERFQFRHLCYGRIRDSGAG